MLLAAFCAPRDEGGHLLTAPLAPPTRPACPIWCTMFTLKSLNSGSGSQGGVSRELQ